MESLLRSLLLFAALVASGIASDDPEDVFCDMKKLQGNEDLSNCTGIKVFFEKLEESEVQKIIRQLAKPKFNLLVLRDSKLSEKQTEAIMQALAKASQMEYLTFRENALSSSAAKDLFAAIKNGKYKEIDLRSTILGDEEASLLASALANTKDLTVLDIDSCSLSSVGVKFIAAALRSPSIALETLHISHNPMGDEGAVAMAYAIRELPKGSPLERVTIRDTSIGTPGRQALRDAAIKAPMVDVYDLRREKIRKSWKDIPAEGKSEL